MRTPLIQYYVDDQTGQTELDHMPDVRNSKPIYFVLYIHTVTCMRAND